MINTTQPARPPLGRPVAAAPRPFAEADAALRPLLASGEASRALSAQDRLDLASLAVAVRDAEALLLGEGDEGEETSSPVYAAAAAAALSLTAAAALSLTAAAGARGADGAPASPPPAARLGAPEDPAPPEEGRSLSQSASGKGQMGSALMGSRQNKCFLT